MVRANIYEFHLFGSPHSLIMLHNSEITPYSLFGNIYHVQEVMWGLLLGLRFHVCLYLPICHLPSRLGSRLLFLFLM